ncbi:hypothetical protein [Carboxylicivirga caseinilyticus]|uniref:hypothetical protein n=1 Tax=Carboxylicivirga caseinilyticus TaxID=3417572 RepID=UPI002AA7FF6B|nr:hypothetical protein [uncultured Carboxylicivirga sp.]MCU4165943.1 hypothetical protein [Marinilabiliaceae bacterium A049]
MTEREKKRKAAMIAVAYYLEQEKAAAAEVVKPANNWAAMGKGMIMNNRTNVQRKGRLMMKAV